ncbi:MAG: pilin [Candidatus Andersenbacteria bacterium]
MNNHRLVLGSLTILLVMSMGVPLSSTLAAADFTDFTQGLGIAGDVARDNNLPMDQDAKVLLRRVINYILGFVSLLGLLFLIIAGAMYITSLGDEKKAAQAKKLILYVIVGLLIVGLSAIIVNTVIIKFVGGQ